MPSFLGIPVIGWLQIAVGAALVLFVLAAVAYLVPAAPFLNYDPADVVVAIAGFLYGPI